MTRNRRRPAPKVPKVRKPRREFSFFKWVSRFLPLEKVFAEKKDAGPDKVPVQYFYYFLWVVFLLVAYEWVGYTSEKFVRQSISLKRQVEGLRAEFTTTKADYMRSGKQSIVAEKVKPMGLEENLKPPLKIVSPSSER